MIVKTVSRLFIHAAFFLCACVLFIYGQDRSALISEFNDRSIPAEEIQMSNDSLIVKLNYKTGEEFSSAKLDKDINMVFLILADKFPNSKTIRIEVFQDGEFIYPYEGNTRGLQDIFAGRIQNPEKGERGTLIQKTEDTQQNAEPDPSQKAEISGARQGGSFVNYRKRSGWPIIGIVFFMAGSIILLTLILSQTRKEKTLLRPGIKIIAELEVIYEDGGRKSFRIRNNKTTIGRDKNNSLPISDDKASAQHAEILVSPESFLLKDLGSTNGTFVNGQKISECVLWKGDTIIIGSTRLKFGPD